MNNRTVSILALGALVITLFTGAYSGFGDGGFVWGKGDGTLSAQTDLQAALNAKLATNGDGSALTGLTKTQVGLANVDNTSDANKPISTAEQTALNLKANLASPTFTGTVVLPAGQALVTPALGTPASGTLTNCMFPTLNQNTSGSAASLSVPLTFANGGDTGSAATSATTGTITVNMTTSVITCTPTGAMTYNGSGGVVGQVSTFVITTSGVSSFVLTWGTNYKTTGTLATGVTTAKVFTVTFRCYATNSWAEIGRTTAM